MPTESPSPTAEPTQVPEPQFEGDPVLTPRDLPGETESPVAVLGPGPVPPGAIAGSFKDDLTIEQISESTIEITFNALPTRRDPSDPCAWWYGAFLARADDGEVRVWLRSYYVPGDVPCEEEAPRQVLPVTNTALDGAAAIVPGPLPTPDG